MASAAERSRVFPCVSAGAGRCGLFLRMVLGPRWPPSPAAAVSSRHETCRLIWDGRLRPARRHARSPSARFDPLDGSASSAAGWATFALSEAHAAEARADRDAARAATSADGFAQLLPARCARSAPAIGAAPSSGFLRGARAGGQRSLPSVRMGANFARARSGTSSPGQPARPRRA